jgi:alpha-2-macroglobulin
MIERIKQFFSHFFNLFKQGRFWCPLLSLLAILAVDEYFYTIPSYFYWGGVFIFGLFLLTQVFGRTRWFQSIFGQVSWQGPSWSQSLDGASGLVKKLTARPKVLGPVLISLLLISGLSYWWINRPQPTPPPSAMASISVPNITRQFMDNSGKIVKETSKLYLNFDESVAPLKNIGKELDINKEKAISLRPKIKGKWKWNSERGLTFTPEEDWKPGEKYELEFEQSLTSGPYIIENKEFEFTMEKMKVSNSSKEFYEDPRDPRQRKAIFSVTFNYPFDREQIANKIKLNEVEYLKGGGKKSERTLEYKLVFGKLNYQVHIHSGAINIPAEEGSVELTIEDGVKNTFGDDNSSFELTESVRVPGMYNYFNVSGVELNIVDNEKGIPEHIGMIHFSTGVAPSRVKDAVSVYKLPYKDKKGKRIYWSFEKVQRKKVDVSSLPKIPIKIMPAAATYPKNHMFKIKSKPKHYYIIQVEKGLESASEFKLGDRLQGVVKAEQFPRKLKLLHDGSILSLKGDQKIHLYSINVKRIDVKIGQVLNKQVHHILTQTHGDFKDPSFQNKYNFSEKNLAHFENYEIDVSDSSAIRPSYNNIDFSDYLNRKVEGRKTRGVFFVEIKSDRGSIIDRRLILLSDLGVMVKKDVAGNRNVFIQSLYSGKPVANADVEVIGQNGIPLFRDNTNSSGHLFIPSIENEDEFSMQPKGILVKKGNDLAFMKYSDYHLELSFSRFAVGGQSNARGQDALSAYMFSDRGVYRPGEEVRIGLIAKSGKWSRNLSGIPVDLEVENSRGKIIQKESRTLRANGLDDLIFNLHSNSPTGEYSVSLYNFFDNDRKKYRSLVGSVSIKVEEFLPDRLKIKTELSKRKFNGWVTPEDIKGQIDLQNLFGYPAEGHRVRAKMKIEPIYLSFSKYRDFRFDNPTKDLESYSEDLTESTTNDKGLAEYSLDLDRFAKKVFRLKFIAEGFEKEGGRSVSAQISTLVSPYPYLVGISAEGDFYYIKRNDQKKVRYLAVNSDLDSVEVNDLTFELLEYKYVNVLTKRPNGSFAYESVRKEETIKKDAFKIAKDGLSFDLNTSLAGDFKIKIAKKDGTLLSEFRYTVAGARDLARSMGKSTELQVKLNKKDYNPGEVIELEIKAPYVGHGLITIERDKVYKHQWFHQSKKTSIHRISIPDDLEGNAYVNITLLRDKESPEIYSRPLSYGVFPFTINKDSRREQVTFNVAEVAKPGERLKISYQTKRDSEVILYAVNEGILQFAKYKNPRPLDYFFTKKSLGVRTFQILDYLLPEYSIVSDMLAPGGGFGAMSEHLNPFNRKLKKPVAYWSGVVKSGPLEKDWFVDIPGHFNGTLRIIGVAVGNRTIGSNARKMYVRADLIITPNVLTFASPGDKFDIPVTVLNNVEKSGKEFSVDLNLQTSGHVKVEGAKKLALKIDERKDSSHIFKMTAQDKLGSASLNFIASGGEFQNKIEETLSLRPSSPFYTSLKVGTVKDDKIVIPINRKLYSEYAKREMAIGATPLVFSGSLSRFLNKNPYGCTEQLISMAMPHLILSKEKSYGYNKKKASKYLEKTLNIIRSRITNDGLVLLYPEYYTERPYLTLYTLHFLLTAKEKGFNIDKRLYKRITSNIKKNIKSWSSLYEQAYGIYLLTLAEEVTTPFLMHIENDVRDRLAEANKNERNSWGTDLVLSYVAASYKLLKNEKKAMELIAPVKLKAKEASSYYSYYSGDIRDARLIEIMARHFPAKAKEITSNQLMSLFRDLDKRINSLNAAYLLMALDSYEKYFKSKSLIKFEVAEYRMGKNKKLAKHILSRKTGEFKFTKKAEKIEISNPNDSNLFYAYSLAGFDKGAPKPRKEGLEVFKELLGPDGKPTTSVKQGDEVTIVIKFRATNDKSYDDVALIDLLPTGFENVLTDEGKPQGQSGYSPHFIDVREDRVIAYGQIAKDLQELRYKVKATNIGEFVFPATLIEDMYHRENKAIGVQAKLVVTKP